MKNYKKPFYHFSIDDVIDSLIEVSNFSNNLFSQPFFKFLYTIHQKYNTNVDLYCFYQKNTSDKPITLNDVSNNYKEIFSKNPWLRFGPHALDTETAPYSQTSEQQIQVFDLIYKEIEIFNSITYKCELIILHFFT